MQLYNDGYAEILADKHPGGLGQPTRECWPEVWHINGPIYQRVWQGETITYEDKLYRWRGGDGSRMSGSPSPTAPSAVRKGASTACW